jgi:hypothetical protein
LLCSAALRRAPVRIPPPPPPPTRAPAQTKDTPDESDPLRRFYTTLLAQVPASEMARRWCAQFGLLPRADAEKWVLEQAALVRGAERPTACRCAVML